MVQILLQLSVTFPWYYMSHKRKENGKECCHRCALDSMQSCIQKGPRNAILSKDVEQIKHACGMSGEIWLMKASNGFRNWTSDCWHMQGQATCCLPCPHFPVLVVNVASQWETFLVFGETGSHCLGRERWTTQDGRASQSAEFHGNFCTADWPPAHGHQRPGSWPQCPLTPGSAEERLDELARQQMVLKQKRWPAPL